MVDAKTGIEGYLPAFECFSSGRALTAGASAQDLTFFGEDASTQTILNFTDMNQASGALPNGKAGKILGIVMRAQFSATLLSVNVLALQQLLSTAKVQLYVAGRLVSQNTLAMLGGAPEWFSGAAPLAGEVQMLQTGANVAKFIPITVPANVEVKVKLIGRAPGGAAVHVATTGIVCTLLFETANAMTGKV